MEWHPVQKPAEMTENWLLEAILSGKFLINSNLPGERELARQIGVTRSTLREALQRLARDGWLDIQQGKPTRVCDYWREGSLAVLTALAQSPAHQSPDFVVHLLDLRVLIAPAYARQAIQTAAAEIIALLESCACLEDTPTAFAKADWTLHSILAQHATNPVFQLLLNGFQSLYLLVGEHYFSSSVCRQHSRNFYQSLLECARCGAACDAESLTHLVMEESLALAKNMQKEST